MQCKFCHIWDHTLPHPRKCILFSLRNFHMRRVHKGLEDAFSSLKIKKSCSLLTSSKIPVFSNSSAISSFLSMICMTFFPPRQPVTLDSCAKKPHGWVKLSLKSVCPVTSSLSRLGIFNSSVTPHTFISAEKD